MATTNAIKQKLLKELNELRELADAQTDLWRRSNELLYRTLSKTYIWWQSASAEKGFLEGLYKENNIQYKSEINADINFSPLLRYLWGMDGRQDSVYIDNWNRALNQIHIKVVSNKPYYKSNTLEKLISLIQNEGGIRGLAKYDSQITNQNNDKPKRKVKIDLNVEKKRIDAHLEQGKVYFGDKARAITKFTSSKPLPTADSAIGLALVRKTNSGYDILSAVDDKELIEQAIVRTYKRSTEGVPYTIKLLAEIIRSQTLPLPMKQMARSLNEPSSHKDEDGKRINKLKRVLYMAQKRVFILSANRSSCSPVTIAMPNKGIVEGKEDVFLAINDRTFIEDYLLHTGDINFYSTNFKDKLQKSTADEASTYKLLLENFVTKKIRYIRFYPITSYKFEGAKEQAIIKNGLKFKPKYATKLDSNWVDSMNGNYLSGWANKLGKVIKRKPYETIGLTMSKSGLAFSYGKRADGWEEVTNIPFSKLNNNKTLSVSVLSKDILPVLNALVTTEILGQITLEADEKAIFFKYKTDCAEYWVAIPTCNESGKRNDEYFQSYGA